ncbi:ComEC/Rec2 family competence protein [Aureimonas sp. ME7]|uniref:ComEC/Rec2 family competence protein n=1 Tax=Aureimonas sp. ME7 TaxID=2744252 RepID=UPI001FCEC056|nr:ComEC/Rec2 family competence protein [Aureimonas sp. ME7]
MAAALITGERAGIPEKINDDLRVTGLAHVLSISGYHMALVAGLFMLAVRAMAALVPGLSLHRATKKIAAVVSLGATTFYFLLSGDNAATERSYIMIAVMLGAVLLDRPALTLRNVAIAAIIVMALSPHVVLSATFQMSFAATAALVGAYGAYSRWRIRRPKSSSAGLFSPKNIALILFGMAFSSLIAGAATAPFAVYHFQRGAPFALFANVLASPLFSFWIMPLGMIAVLAMPFGLQDLPLRGMGAGLDVVFAMTAWLADRFPDYPTGMISAQALLLWTAAILILSFSASSFRWFCAPLTLAGFLVSQPPDPPELLVFESGRELALIEAGGALHPIRDRTASFVWDQWKRAFPNHPASGSEPSSTTSVGSSGTDRFRCENEICRGQTRSGLRISWSDDYTRLADLCEGTDVAIVARAMVAKVCDNGTTLVTLRSLRRTGSLSISRSADTGLPVLQPSIADAPAEWNAHRNAPWPEYWRKPANSGPDADNPGRRVSDTDGSARPDDPAP